MSDSPSTKFGPFEHRQGLLWLAAALGLVLVFHGALLFSQSFVRTYDALIHIFFGAHYASSWFDPWESRWYTGFLTVSYPPLSHQLIAVLSFLVGLKPAFALVQLFALLNLTVGMYRFSSLLTSPRAAGMAALFLGISSSIVETVHVFGQLPTTLSLSFLLNGLVFAVRYVRGGRKAELLKAVCFVAATTAAHHVTTLFGTLFFAIPVLLVSVLEAFRCPRPLEPTGEDFRSKVCRRFYRILPRVYRSVLFGGLTGVALLLVVFPFWIWNRSDPITQVSIPHASRDNFLVNTAAGLMFFVIPWLSTFAFLPFAIYKGLGTWRFPVALSLLILFVLGTGGTTPIPKLLLRGSFDILTLDRFTFWATMLMIPFVGMAFESLLYGRAREYLEANLGRRIRLLLLGGLCLSLIVIAIAVSSLTRYRKFQPEPIAVEPIVNFLEKDEHWRYRYLTLGFGDQMAWLSANTRALTPDGNYHSARRLIELTTTPVERLDGAKYTSLAGIGSLHQFVTVPEKYNLKFIFSNDAFYDPLLFFSGWHRLSRLENGIVVWEREDIPPLPERLPRKTMPLYQRLMWGTLPPLAMLMAFFSLAVPVRASRIKRYQLSKLGRKWLRLLREDALEAQAAGAWQPWRGWNRPLEVVLDFSRKPLWLRGARVGGLVVAAILLGSGLWRVTHPVLTPERAVLAYWDNVDFKRFQAAYNELQPLEGLTFTRYLLDLSVQGGLRSGYAKLDRIEPSVIAEDAKHALVRTQLGWQTSLKSLNETVTQELELTKDGWKILTRPLQLVRSRDRFAEEASVSYYRAPRRLTTDVSAAGDVLDRPQLTLAKTRLVSSLMRVQLPGKFSTDPPRFLTQRIYSVIGELWNIDARPADVTVTALLRDKSGKELQRNNAGLEMMHKLLPGERSAFRIDFDATNAPVDFAQVSDFEVFAKAVVTQRNLDRPLAVWVAQRGNDLDLSLMNVGTVESQVPQVLVSYYDAAGIAWLQTDFALESIPPRQKRSSLVQSGLPFGYRLERMQRRATSASVVFDSNRIKPPPTFSTALTRTKGLRFAVQAQAFESEP